MELKSIFACSHSRSRSAVGVYFSGNCGAFLMANRLRHLTCPDPYSVFRNCIGNCLPLLHPLFSAFVGYRDLQQSSIASCGERVEIELMVGKGEGAGAGKGEGATPVRCPASYRLLITP